VRHGTPQNGSVGRAEPTLTSGYPTGTLTAELDAIVRREGRLAAKADAVQERVTEVKVVLIAAAEAAGANERELSGSAADAAIPYVHAALQHAVILPGPVTWPVRIPG
jgi:hypothetical protein